MDIILAIKTIMIKEFEKVWRRIIMKPIVLIDHCLGRVVFLILKNLFNEVQV